MRSQAREDVAALIASFFIVIKRVTSRDLLRVSQGEKIECEERKSKPEVVYERIYLGRFTWGGSNKEVFLDRFCMCYVRTLCGQKEIIDYEGYICKKFANIL